MDTKKHELSRSGGLRVPEWATSGSGFSPDRLPSCSFVSIRGSKGLVARGTVTLVALCFTTVLGISLAGYITVCSRTMQLSNRTFQGGLSRQLAELGLEEGLRAFNKNLLSGTDTTAALADWSTGGVTANWTLDTTNKRATATITFPATKFGQGVTGSVKIRVDNYDAAQLGSTWSSSTTYRTNDLVGYNGIWYRSVRNGNSNQTPGNLAWWAQAPIPWAWSSNTSYSQNTGSSNNSVIFDGSTSTWYFCNTAHTSGNTSTFSADSANSGKWTAMAPPTLAWTSSTSYSVNQQVYNTGDNRWYRCKTAHTSTSSFDSANFDQGTVVIAWRWQNNHVYAYNQVVYYNQTWYRCILSHTVSGSSPDPTNTTYWENALTGSMHAWSSGGIKYNVGDSVYYGATSQRYRCLIAHTSTSSTTPDSTTYPYWANTPAYPTQWDSNRQYSQNDTVRYNGVWYRSLQNSNTNQNPVTATTYWIGSDTATASYQWNATTAYAVGDYRCYGGVWYKCISATTANAGHSPNHTTYWTSSWANSWNITTGAPVVYAEGTVTVAGSASNVTQLRATLAPAPLFPNAAAATTTISANSGGTVDSYDFSTGTYASQINTATNYSAVVAAGSTITLSSTAVKGYLAWPSPPAGIGGSVKGFTSPASPNIDLTRISRSPYIPQFDTLPSGGLAANWATTPKGTALVLATTINIGTPGAVTPSRYWFNGNLTIDGSSVTTMNINGPVILYINGDLRLDGSASNFIAINDTGSAEIHIAGRLRVNINSNGFYNLTQDPKKLIVICDTSSTSGQNYSDGSNAFYGVIYMPNTTNSNGLLVDNTTVQIYGAISAKKITYSGANMNIHYDTSLRYATFGGVDQPHAITEWRELTDAAELATMP